MIELSETMAFFPNSSCIPTFMIQLTSITQKVIKPAFAPSTVVAINSPEPTIEADRINPGPKNPNIFFIVVGGFLMD
jgi:hypothetical protein